MSQSDPMPDKLRRGVRLGERGSRSTIGFSGYKKNWEKWPITPGKRYSPKGIPALPEKSDADSRIVRATSITIEFRLTSKGILTKWSDLTNPGYGLFVNESEQLEFAVKDRKGIVEKFSSGRELVPRNWYFVAASFDSEKRRIVLVQENQIGSLLLVS